MCGRQTLGTATRSCKGCILSGLFKVPEHLDGQDGVTSVLLSFLFREDSYFSRGFFNHHVFPISPQKISSNMGWFGLMWNSIVPISINDMGDVFWPPNLRANHIIKVLPLMTKYQHRKHGQMDMIWL